MLASSSSNTDEFLYSSENRELAALPIGNPTTSPTEFMIGEADIVKYQVEHGTIEANEENDRISNAGNETDDASRVTTSLTPRMWNYAFEIGDDTTEKVGINSQMMS